MKFYIIISTLFFNAVFGGILNIARAGNASYDLIKKLEKDLKKQNANVDDFKNQYNKKLKAVEKEVNNAKQNTDIDSENPFKKNNNTTKTVVKKEESTAPKGSFEDNFKKVEIKEEFNPFKQNIDNEEKTEVAEENKKQETMAVDLNKDVYSNQNEDIEKINTEKENDLAQKRREIIEEFRKKLEENKRKDATIETIQKEIIADDFAVIIEDDDAVNDNLISNDEDKKLLTDAQAPITIKFEDSITEEEYKNRYLSELKESINRKKQEQNKKTERVMASKTTPKNKETDDNKIEIEKIIASRKKDLDDKENDSKDPEVFNITDNGVSMEILSEKRFSKLLDNRVELLKDNMENEEAPDFLVPVEKKLINFKVSEIPPELLEPHRSEENRHIPFVLRATDFQEIVKTAIDNNDINVLRGVIELLKEPDYILENGQTALNYASVSGSTEILKYLLYSGANVNIQDYNGNTPLHNAILREDNKIIKLLVENNSNLNIFNIDGYTPLMLSIVNGKNDISAYLIKFDQDLTQQNYKKETILDLTNKFNRDIIKELVLEKIKETKIEK